MRIRVCVFVVLSHGLELLLTEIAVERAEYIRYLRLHSITLSNGFLGREQL